MGNKLFCSESCGKTAVVQEEKTLNDYTDEKIFLKWNDEYLDLDKRDDFSETYSVKDSKILKIFKTMFHPDLKT